MSFISDSKLSSLIGNAPDSANSTDGTNGANGANGTNSNSGTSGASSLLLRDAGMPVAGFATMAVMILVGAALL